MDILCKKCNKPTKYEWSLLLHTYICKCDKCYWEFYINKYDYELMVLEEEEKKHEK